MPGKIYGTVTKAGAAVKAATQGHRRGAGNKNVSSGATRRPNPTGSIKSATRPIKGMDRGAG